MDNRTKELIAIGASVAANCQPCLDYHRRKAQEFGAGEQEIREAIAVGTTVRTGAARKLDEYALALLANESVTSDTAEDLGGCDLA